MTEVIKVVKAGVDVSNGDIRNIILSSEYPMFKYGIDTTASVVIAPGGLSATTTIAHGLGYVPAFIVYSKRSDQSKYYIVPFFSGITGSDFADAWADSSNITVGAYMYSPWNRPGFPWNQNYFDFGGGSIGMVAGDYGSGNGGSAVRFINVTLNPGQTITSATLSWKDCLTYSTHADTKMTTYGINEGNCASLSSSPMGRSRTSAVTNQNVPYQGGFFNLQIDVTSQVQEILNRGDWANGNAMGFMTFDNGSPSNAAVYESDKSALDSATLEITLPGSLTVNFKVIVFKDKLA